MALVESLSLPPNTYVSEFSLPTPNNEFISLSDSLGAKGCLIVFTCNHCPYAIAIWPRLIRLAKWAKQYGISTIAINPNIHPNYTQDSPENMRKLIQEWNLDFPYLVDADQRVARAYQAQCTPDLYLITPTKQLYYHGRFDDNWQNEQQVTSQDLKQAMQHLLDDDLPPAMQYPAMGCSIKWQTA